MRPIVDDEDRDEIRELVDARVVLAVSGKDELGYDRIRIEFHNGIVLEIEEGGQTGYINWHIT
jgi:hypothetical protein